MRRSRTVALLATLAATLIAFPQVGALARDGAPRSGASALAAPSALQVQTLNFVFLPDPVKIPVGQTLRWFNPVLRANHTATNVAPLALWDSGEIAKGGSYSFTFTAAGSYPYICTIHERFDMVSIALVQDLVDPPSGPVGTMFTVTVATIPAPTDYVYDVQKRNPGGQWKAWMTGITSTTAVFDSTGFPIGRYQFRSRLHRLSDDAASEYSPAVSISVT